MNHEVSILDNLYRITEIARDTKHRVADQLDTLLHEICALIQAEKASIMMKRGKHSLEVVASTRTELVGLRQPIDINSPSCWVLKNKKPLYMAGNKKAPDEITCNPENYRTDAFFLVPVFTDDQISGVLSITDKAGDGQFSRKERELVLHLASLTIGAIENHRRNERLKKQQALLKKKNQQLREYEKIRREFFNMLIHDLKGPISEVVANLDILSYTATEENMTFVSSAQSSCDTIFQMISNLLDIARLENGMLKLIPERLEAAELIREALSMVDGQARMQNIRLSHPPEKETPHFLIADRNILLRVFQNILMNAIAHSPAGASIDVRHQVTGKRISFHIDDQGPGVPLDFQETIFDKYVQVDQRTGRKRHATGLGLNFCKLAVEAHKGKIFVESDGECGSSFRFTLPLAKPSSLD